MSLKISIIGAGVVGKAMQSLFPQALIYDEPLGIGSRENVMQSDVAFICVPTPGIGKGALDVTIVETVVKWLRADLIILRSTVNPGTTDALKQRHGKRIVFQPEYLGETVSHPLYDLHDRPFMVLGGDPEDTRRAIEIYHRAYNASVRIRQTNALTAELIKLAENRAIAHKVAEVQELYDLCEATGVDYYIVREAVYQDDPRMSPYWTFVYPEQRGFNSKCIPKDIYAIADYARRNGVPLEVTEALLQRNERYLQNKNVTHAVAAG